MRIAVLLVGLLIVLGGVFAAQPQPVLLVEDTIQTYRDSAFAIPGTTFRDGAIVYVKIHNNNVTHGPGTTSRQITVYRESDPVESILFDVYDNGANLDPVAYDGYYHGNFTIGTAPTEDGLVDHLQLAHSENAFIKSNMDSTGDYIEFPITADYEAPENFNCSVEPASQWLNETKQFNVTLYGELSGTAWFTYNGTNVSLPNIGGNVYSFNYTVQPNEEHKGPLVCWHSDVVGNEANTTTPEELWVDTLAPAIAPVSPSENGWTNNNSTAIMFNVTDAASGVASVSASANGTGVLANVGDEYTVTGGPYADGNVTVVVNATDNAGNNATRSWNFTVDTALPYMVNITSPSEGGKYNGQININYTAYDALSPTMDCNISAAHSAGGMIGSNLTTYHNGTEWHLRESMPADGNITLSLVCTDLAGNSNSSSIWFIYDNTGPAITNTPDLNNSYMKNGTLLVFDIADELSGVNTTLWTNGTINYTMQNNISTTGWPEGQHNITVYANDSVGNVGSAYFEFNIDDTPPANVTGLAATGGANQISLSWNSVGDAAHYIVYRSEDGGTTYAFLKTSIVNNPVDTGLGNSVTRYYRVSAVDAAGNEGNWSNEASATTNAAQGSGGGSGGGTSQTVIRTDPPLDNFIETPIVLPEEEEELDTQESGGWMKEKVQEEGGGDETANLKPGRVKGNVGPMTGLLFQEGSFLFGLAALLVFASVWIMWSSSKRNAKKKWYEE